MSTQAWRRVPQRPARISTTITPAMPAVTTRAGPQATRSRCRDARSGVWHGGHGGVGAPLHALGEHVLVLQHRMQGQIRHRSGAICQRWRGHRHRQRPCAASPCQHRSFTGPGGIANRTRNDLHLPDAPGDPPGSSGNLPQVRDDAGAPAARPRRRQPGVA